MREVVRRFAWGSRAFGRRRDGAAAVEFALVAPLFILLLAGMLSYGGYLWTAHSVQQLANDAARAAIAGLDDPERLALAREAVSETAPNLGPFDPLRTRVTATRDGQTFTVRVVYDAGDSAFWALEGIVPMPPREVARAATIRLGGF